MTEEWILPFKKPVGPQEWNDPKWVVNFLNEITLVGQINLLESLVEIWKDQEIAIFKQLKESVRANNENGY